MAARKSTLSIYVRTLCHLIGWFLAAFGAAEAQGVGELRELFLREHPLWLPGNSAADEPARLVEALKESSWSSWVLLREGERTIELGKYELADYAMSELIASQPPGLVMATALYNRGTVAMHQREFGRARFYFNEAIAEAMKQRGGEAETIAGIALYSIGLAHAIERDQPAEKTVGLIQEFLEHYPDSPRERDALHLLAELAETRGDCELALEYYEKIFEKFPTNENLDAKNHTAHCLAQLGRYREAEELLESVNRTLDAAGEFSTTPPQQRERIRAEARLLRGEIEMVMKNYAAAENAFIPLVSDPQSHYRRQGLLGLAATYQAARRHDSALAIYQRLLAEDSLDAVRMRAQFNKALALRALGRRTEADTILTAIAYDEKNVMSDRALVELGLGAYERRDYAAAGTALEKAVAIAHNDALRARAYTLLGAVRLGEGDPIRAIEAFEAADKISSSLKGASTDEVPEARLLRGITLARVDRSAEAITVLNRFIDRYPHHTAIDQALYWLGESYYHSSLYKAAVDVMGTLVEQHPGSSYVPDALYTMGWSELRQKRFERAESVFGQLVKAFPLSSYTAEAQLRRGDALYLAGDYENAIDAYRQATKLNPSAEEAAYADYQSALANYRLGQLDEADTLFQSFASCYTSSDLVNDAIYLRGDIALRQGASERAIAIMSEFIGRSHQEDLLPHAYGAIGEAQMKLGNRRLASAAFSIVQERFPASRYVKQAQEAMAEIARAREEEEEAGPGGECPASMRLAIDRGEIYRRTGHHSDALREYRSVDPSRLDDVCRQDHLLGIARSRIAIGEQAQAVDTLRLVIDRFPGSGAAHAATLELATVYRALGDTANAIASLEGLLRELGDSTREGSSGALQLAAIHAHAGRIDTALALYRMITRLHPTGEQAELAWIALARFTGDAAERDIVRAALTDLAGRSDSTGAAALLALADLSSRRGDNQEELRLLQEIIRRFGGDQKLRGMMTIRLGEVFERAGATGRARETYQEIIRRACDDEFRKQAQEHLDALGRI